MKKEEEAFEVKDEAREDEAPPAKKFRAVDEDEEMGWEDA